MEHFTPLTATIGGVLIGLATTILWVFNGRLAGISTIAGNAFPIRRGDELWRVLFLVGLPIGGWLGFVYGPRLFAELPTTLPEIGLGAGLAGRRRPAGRRRHARSATAAHPATASAACRACRYVPSSRSAPSWPAPALTVFIVRHVL